MNARKIMSVHPFGFGLYYVLNASTILARPTLWDALFSSLFILIFVYLMMRISRVIVKDGPKSGLIASLLLVPFLFYPQYWNIFLRIIQSIAPAVARFRYATILLIILVGSSIVLILRTKRRLSLLAQYLNVLSICFVAYGVVLFLQARDLGAVPPLEGIARVQAVLSQAREVPDIRELPDIYYIVLDTYTGPKALLKHMKFSNDRFVDDLSQRGFYVAEESQAIAPATLKSMVSSLNMIKDKELLSTPRDILLAHIRSNAVEEFLRSKGYETVNFSLFPLGDTPPFYKIYFNPRASKIMKIYEKTLLLILAERIEESFNYKHNLKILSSLKAAPLSREDRPRFVYAHLMIPHEPYQFDREGNIIPYWKRRGNMDIRGYTEQILGTNKLILEVVDEILRGSSIQPVIILQGDHGFRGGRVGKVSGLPILNAYFLPTRKTGELYPSIPPYNSFRVVLNAYFDTNLELLD